MNYVIRILSEKNSGSWNAKDWARVRKLCTRQIAERTGAYIFDGDWSIWSEEEFNGQRLVEIKLIDGVQYMPDIMEL